MIQQYAFKDGGRDINAKGSFFRYESASEGSGVTDIRLRIDGTDVGVYAPGDAIELPTSARRWEIIAASSGCIGLVKIGEGRITSTKLMGVVQTVDGGRARSLADRAFAVYGYKAQVASQNPFVQLFNPAGSKKVAVVNGISLGANATQTAHIRTGNVAVAGSHLSAGVSKRNGNASVVGVRVASNASFTWVGGTDAMAIFLTAGKTEQHKPTEPWIVTPGNGLVLVGSNQASDLGASFEWFEEDE